MSGAQDEDDKSCSNTMLWIALAVVIVMYMSYRLDIRVYIARAEKMMSNRQCSESPWGCDRFGVPNGPPNVP